MITTFPSPAPPEGAINSYDVQISKVEHGPGGSVTEKRTIGKVYKLKGEDWWRTYPFDKQASTKEEAVSVLFESHNQMEGNR